MLAPGEIPTIDFYLRDRLKNRFGENVRYVNVLQTCPDEFAPIDDPLVVVVRHAPRRWLRWLADQQPNLCRDSLFNGRRYTISTSGT